MKRPGSPLYEFEAILELDLWRYTPGPTTFDAPSTLSTDATTIFQNAL